MLKFLKGTALMEHGYSLSLAALSFAAGVWGTLLTKRCSDCLCKTVCSSDGQAVEIDTTPTLSTFQIWVQIGVVAFAILVYVILPTSLPTVPAADVPNFSNDGRANATPTEAHLSLGDRPRAAATPTFRRPRLQAQWRPEV